MLAALKAKESHLSQLVKSQLREVFRIPETRRRHKDFKAKITYVLENNSQKSVKGDYVGVILKAGN